MEKAQRGQGATTKWAAAQSADKNFAKRCISRSKRKNQTATKKTQFYMFVIQQRLSNFFKRKCEKCGSRRLNKVLSTFAPNCVKSNADTMNELSRMGNINFVPQSPGMGGHQGPPPGGCPYANSTDSQPDD